MLNMQITCGLQMSIFHKFIKHFVLLLFFFKYCIYLPVKSSVSSLSYNKYPEINYSIQML
jgi:hypothetical protein